MRKTYSFFNYTWISAVLLLTIAACKKEKYALPTGRTELSNDAIKRTLGPNIVGLPIEFAYAMAIPADKGKIVSAQVEASIEGASGTFLQHNSYYTNGSGVDVGVPVGTPSVNAGAVTTVNFNKDTNAATLRYTYVVPEAARGQSVSFTFTATADDGSKATYKLGPYTVSKMDIKRLIPVTNGNAAYISIADMAVYNTANVAANAAKVDLVYLYRATPSTFAHALVSPAADAQYLPGVTLPTGVNKNTKVLKVFNLQDYNLARIAVGVYIDDADFQKLDLTTAPNYAINLKGEAGTWVETADGRYRAYIFFNSVNSNGSAVISILRYAL
jgi:hypothetical protein